jgi:Flp pilus assembly protein TadD
MFFPRLRRQAKWVFLFLALAMGGGFVIFGVGAGGIGVGNIFEGRADSGVPSVGDAEERVAENPKDVQAHRDLALAQEADGNTDGAIEALEQLVALKPKDARALLDLGRLYLLKMEEAQIRAQRADVRATYIVPGASIAETTLGGQPLEADKISSVVSSQLSESVSTALQEAQTAASQAVGAYKRRADSRPKNPTYQVELAQIAESVGDVTTAITAYEQFLKLDPRNPQRPEVERKLKELKAQAGPTTGSTG